MPQSVPRAAMESAPLRSRYGSVRRILLEWAVTHAIVVLAFVPYFFAAVLPAAQAGGSAWLAPHWEPLTAIPETLWAFLPAGAYPIHLHGLSVLSVDTVATQPGWLVVTGRILPAVVIVSILFFLIRSGVRSPVVLTKGNADAPTDGRGWPLYVFAGGLTLLPLILAWCYSFLIRPNYLVARYDLIAWPACMVLLALVISDASRRVAGRRAGLAAVGVCAVLVGCSLVPITRMAALQPPSTLHNVRAQRLAALASSGDLVITFSYDGDHLAYYLHRARFRGETASYPSWLDRRIGWVDTQADL
ncbi:MAG: hypothetical protein IID43_04540, partial [Planctomycetes bacterium]|nr:hypothetical protein [Planctomycetota bacterium]